MSSTGSNEQRLSFKQIREEKERLLKAKFGYSDEANPFNDANLSAPFVWKKKQQLLIVSGRDDEVIRRKEQLTEIARQKTSHIEHVRKRREQHEREIRELDEQRALLAREKEQENYDEWAKREERFHREVVLTRADTRIRQGRESTADALIKEFRIAQKERFGNMTIAEEEIADRITALTDEHLAVLIEDTNELLLLCEGVENGERFGEEEITWAQRLEGNDIRYLNKDNVYEFKRFWTAIRLLSDREHKKRIAAAEKAPAQDWAEEEDTLKRDPNTGLPEAIFNDIQKLLMTKNESELLELKLNVDKKLGEISADPTCPDDPSYWKAVAEILPIAIAPLLIFFLVFIFHVTIPVQAVAVTRELHRQACALGEPVSGDMQAAMIGSPGSWGKKPRPPPVIITISVKMVGKSVCLKSVYQSPEDFLEKMAELRAKRIADLLSKQKKTVIKATAQPEETQSEEARLCERFLQDERMNLAPDEIAMDASEDVSAKFNKVYRSDGSWDSMLRLRKPTFFNRVRTGYEWSKYNQAHFDRDNPPPKAVQGYRFSIFYPDLIDKTKTPTWKLEGDDESLVQEGLENTVLIRFHAGPPYEDLVFRIVNREWDLNPRKGFRNVFDKGVLQLHFNLKRMRYRK